MIYTAALTLILVMDPLGNIPVFLSILHRYDHKTQLKIIARETFIAFLLLCIFLFFGQYILRGLHITGSQLSIAGGIILFLIAIRMIFPSVLKMTDQEFHEEPFIVPLAVPLTAGPSSMATVLLFASRQPQYTLNWFIAIVIASTVFLLIMMMAPILMRVLGRRLLVAIERLMGMLLTTIAVGMFLNGIQEYLHQIR